MKIEKVWMTLVATAIACTATACPPYDGDDRDAQVDADAAGARTQDPPGSDCSCDDECASTSSHDGICVFGVCMLRPEVLRGCGVLRRSCPPAMHLREVHEYGGFVCYPECGAFECEGSCDRFGVCIDTEDTDFWCDRTCASYCSDDD